MPSVISPKLFPGCLFDFGVDFPYLPDITLNQAMEMYWQVRRWRIELSANFTRPSPPPGGSFSWDFNLETGTGLGVGGDLPLVWSGGVPPSSERDLVCGPGNYWGVEVGSGEGAVIGPQTLIFARDDVAAGVVSKFSMATPFLFQNSYILNCDVFANQGLAVAGLFGPGSGFPLSAPCGSFVMNLNSGPVTAEFICNHVPDFFINLNLTMTPAEYWPYS